MRPVMGMPLVGIDTPQNAHNALEHGLVANGRANDQPALAALVERLGREVARDGRPRVIYCPPGEYLIADATTIWRSGVSLVGAGAGATRFVLANPGNGGMAVALARFNDELDGASTKNHLADCSFMNFEIDGSRVRLAKYDTRAKGLDLQYMLRAMFRDLYIHDCAATGLGCDHLQDGTIQGVIAERCGRQNDGKQPGGAGIGIGIGGWGGVERLDLVDCICTGNARHGIFVELQQGMPTAPRGIKILGTHCVDNRYGISDWGADGLLVASCVLCDNHEVGFDVSSEGTSAVAGRGGLLADCMIDGNGRDGVSLGNTAGPYTVRGNRISQNGRYGYYQHNIKNDPISGREMAIEANDIWMNALDGVHLGAPTSDASVVRNRIRNNGRRTEGAASGRGAGVSYTDISIRDANARWRPDGHKGKTVLVAGQVACIATNTENELRLFPRRPGAASAWEKGRPEEGTPYLIQEEAPPVRAGIAIAAPTHGAWILDNRVWDNQERPTQQRELYIVDGIDCRDCRLQDT
jgi:pectate lyase-like protein